MDIPFDNAISGTAAPAGADRYQPSLLTVNGRIGRLRYFIYGCMRGISVMLVACVFFLLFSPRVAMLMLMLAVAYLAFIPATFILMIRRLNDLDRSRWCSPGATIPFVNLALGLYIMFARGSSGANRFGPAPVANSRRMIMAAAGALPAAFALGIMAGMRGVTLRGMA